MPDREAQIAQVKSHEALMKGAFASETAATIEAAIIYEEGEGSSLALSDAPFETTETIVARNFGAETLYREGKGKTIIIDPGSFTLPGGSYERGGSGPEQMLCLDSNLYQILRGIKEIYHSGNQMYRRGQLFSDRAAYLPDVVFSRGGSIRKADVLLIPEPMRSRALENHRSERECDRTLERRIDTLLTIAAAHECETLIINGFACGSLGYDAQLVIGMFKDWIDAHPGAIGRIVFAPTRSQAPAFEAAFGSRKAKEPKKPVVVEDTDSSDDDDDWRSIELPEGVTIR